MYNKKMKKLNNIEDLSLFRFFFYANKEGEDFVTSGDLAEDLKKSGIKVLPANNPEEGLYGCVLFKEDKDTTGNYLSEKTLLFQNKVLDPITKIVNEESFEDLLKHFEEYKNKDIYMFQMDSPQTLRVGYVAVCGSGLAWHRVGLREWKMWMGHYSPKPD